MPKYFILLILSFRDEVLERICQTAESLSTSDLIDNKIRKSNNWSLLETQAVFASVLPGFYMEGHMGGQINFPSWLGKNSKRSKFHRILCELHSHMRTNISGNRLSLNLDYLYHIRNKIVRPLCKDGVSGVPGALEVMNSYSLTREDLDGILEVCLWSGGKDPMSMVDSKVKAAFTRSYNKNGPMLPYAVTEGSFKKKHIAFVEGDEYGEDEEDEAEEDKDDIHKDVMIKEKKKVVSKSKKDEDGKKATFSKGGRGKKK